MQVIPIKSQDTHNWLKYIHYAKRIPNIMYAFGLYDDNKLLGIVTYGMPASPFLCKGIAGEENKNIVLELNRLVFENPIKNGASILVGNSLKLLPKPSIVVSYADTAQGHVGYVYQACNFMFTGTTKERTDMASEDGKHSRHSKGNSTQRVFRSAKHRYIFICGNKTQKKSLLNQIKYKQEPYPKGDSLRYEINSSIQVQNLLI